MASLSDSTIEGRRTFLLSVQGILERAFALPNNKQEGNYYDEKISVNRIDGVRIGFRSRAAF
jgi:hypothetical protein